VIGDVHSRAAHASAAVSSANLSSQKLQQLQQRQQSQQLHYQTNAHVLDNNNNNQDNTRTMFSTPIVSSSSLHASFPSSLSANTLSTAKSLSANGGKYGTQPRRYSSFEKRLLSAMDQ
jgi:type II secretory pathway pseudopilin PulG